MSRNTKKKASRQYGSGSDSDSSSGSEKANINNDDNDTETFTPILPSELGNYQLSSLKGLDKQIQLMKRLIIFPIKYKAVFSVISDQGLTPNVLLYGPAGTGKTEIVMAIANETQLPIYKVSASQIQSSFQAKSKRNFRKLIETVSVQNELHKNGCIVFFDEADSLLGTFTTQEDTSIVNVFKEYVQVGKNRSPRNASLLQLQTTQTRSLTLVS